jgi:hypothetical protein
MRAKIRNLSLCFMIALGAPAAALLAGPASPAAADCPNGTNWDGTCK